MKEKILFAMLMALVTTGIVSFTLIGFNSGFAGGFIAAWLTSWVLAYCIATPVIILLSPKVQWLAGRLCKPKQAQTARG